jgi:hypothetical protein
MKKEIVIAVLIVVIISLFLFVFLHNIIGKASGLKEADLIYSPLAVGSGPIGIARAEVKNLREMSIFSLSFVKRFLSFPEFFNVNAVIKVTCDNKEVYSYTDSFRMTEYGGLDRTVTLSDLPPNSYCKAEIDLQCSPIGNVYCSEGVENTVYFKT